MFRIHQPNKSNTINANAKERRIRVEISFIRVIYSSMKCRIMTLISNNVKIQRACGIEIRSR